jgi:KaiC/GvpD/RAD55 family RecA-like ATPase
MSGTDIGFLQDDSKYIIPDYKNRYDFFVNEFIKYDSEIPEELKTEYELLFKMFGETEHNKDIRQLLNKYIVKAGASVPMPEIVLSFCDVDGNNKRMVMTRKNISCVTAQAKVGKTFLVKLILSTVIKKGVFQNRLHSELPDGRDKILYIDTEQSEFHVVLGLNQIKEMLTPEFEKQLDRVSVYQFDAVSTLNRLEYVKWLIYNENPDFVVLDGISDLALDTNNLKEADELVTNLRIWATENDCHILNVIHQNPNDIQTKMKGHLGTKLQDKSEIVIGVSIDKENDLNRIVQSLASRNRKPDPFEFTIQENGIPIINEYEVSTAKLNGKKQQKTDKPDYQLFEILTTVFSKKLGEINYYRYTELSDQIILEYEKKFSDNLGTNNAKKLLTKFIDNGWLIKSGDKGFSLYYLGEFNTPF